MPKSRTTPSRNSFAKERATITLGAGNAKDTNAAIHTIDPWPPYVGNTRIPGDGRRATSAIQRMYRNPNPFERQDQSGDAGASSGAGATGAPTPPLIWDWSPDTRSSHSPEIDRNRNKGHSPHAKFGFKPNVALRCVPSPNCLDGADLQSAVAFPPRNGNGGERPHSSWCS